MKKLGNFFSGLVRGIALDFSAASLYSVLSDSPKDLIFATVLLLIFRGLIKLIVYLVKYIAEIGNEKRKSP